MSMTEKGTLVLGVEYNGVRHKEFEMRLPTMADWEAALEEAGEGAIQARVNRHSWARCLVKLGDIPKDKITAELLGSLADIEYGPLSAAEERLRGKLLAASVSSESFGSSS